jgi:hypothetical protein
MARAPYSYGIQEVLLRARLEQGAKPAYVMLSLETLGREGGKKQ